MGSPRFSDMVGTGLRRSSAEPRYRAGSLRGIGKFVRELVRNQRIFGALRRQRGPGIEAVGGAAQAGVSARGGGREGLPRNAIAHTLPRPLPYPYLKYLEARLAPPAARYAVRLLNRSATRRVDWPGVSGPRNIGISGFREPRESEKSGNDANTPIVETSGIQGAPVFKGIRVIPGILRSRPVGLPLRLSFGSPLGRSVGRGIPESPEIPGIQ